MNILGFKIGIFCKHKKWRDTVFENICHSIPAELIKYSMKSANNIQIILKDGTVIKFLRCDMRCGEVFDRIYYQEGINQDIIDKIIYPQWRPIRPVKWEEPGKGVF